MNSKHGIIEGAIRIVFGAIDWVLFLVLGWTYEIFFDVTTVEFFSNETIKNFYSRIQLILGVFMVFKITISVLQAIVDPDKLSDKNNGFSAYIKRMVVCMIMLTVIVPRNVPNANTEYEVQINNNGLLFGTLYSLQSRIMKNNTLGRLILGESNSVVASQASGDQQASSLKKMGTEFKVTILKGFVFENPSCENFANTDAGKKYDEADETDLLMTYINNECGSTYSLYYYPIIGGVVAAVFAFILVGFSVDIAIRAIKIAVLRLIAPIPIISYLDPNSEKKGAFANWVKVLTSTYLDLFIRLAIIYFVIFLIKDIRENGIVIATETSGIMSILVYVVICFGLFFFAKQAPKFIRDVLGLQGTMSNIGLASLLGGTAMAMGGGGLSGFAYGAMNGANAQAEGAATGKAVPLMGAWSSNRDLMAKIRTGDKDAQGGFWGRAQDYLNYSTRERAAERLGLSKENQAIADFNKDRLQEQAMKDKRELELAKERAKAKGAYESQGIDLSRYRNEDGSWKSEDAKTAAYKKFDSQAIEKQIAWDDYEKAYNKSVESEIAASKAAGNAEKIDKARNQLGVSPTIESKYRTNSRTGLKLEHDADSNSYTFVKDAKTFDPLKGSTDTRLSDDERIYVGGNGPGAGHGPGGGHGPHH